MQTSLLQRRRENRFPVAGILGTLRSPHDLRVINLSRRGIAFETEQDIVPGSDYGIELRYRGRVVNVVTSLRWCAFRPSETPDEAAVYRAGGSFLDVEAEVGSLWQGLVPDPGAEAPVGGGRAVSSA
jgi:hypothetical protein